MFRLGDYVLIYEPKKSKKLVKRIGVKPIHTQWGVINPKDIAGRTSGSKVKTHLGRELYIFEPRLFELIENSKIFVYPTQIVRPRDWGLIISFADIKNGSRVIEIGTGSGGFTAFLSQIVAPLGRVYSYEKNPERARIALKNLEALRIPQVYQIKVRDVALKGVDERNVDAVFVDIPEPWSVIQHSYKALRQGGLLISYIPTFNQLYKMIEALSELFEDILIVDHFFRPIQPRINAIRPVLESYVFSAFILFARKIMDR